MHSAIPESVPVGQYSKEAFENLGMWDDVEAKTSFGTNVTEVLSWVAAGSADAGIVYLTDATTSDQFDQVKVIGYAPEGSVSKVIYPVGVVSASTKKDAAQKFVDYLGTDDAALLLCRSMASQQINKPGAMTVWDMAVTV